MQTFKTKQEKLDLYLMMMEEKSKKGKVMKAVEGKGLQVQIDKLNVRLKDAKDMMLDGEMERREYKQIVPEIEPEIERLKELSLT